MRSLLSETLPAGENTQVWDGKDDSGKNLPSGLYFAHLNTEQGSSVKKLMLIK